MYWYKPGTFGTKICRDNSPGNSGVPLWTQIADIPDIPLIPAFNHSGGGTEEAKCTSWTLDEQSLGAYSFNVTGHETSSGQGSRMSQKETCFRRRGPVLFPGIYFFDFSSICLKLWGRHDFNDLNFVL